MEKEARLRRLAQMQWVAVTALVAMAMYCGYMAVSGVSASDMTLFGTRALVASGPQAMVVLAVFNFGLAVYGTVRAWSTTVELRRWRNRPRFD